MASLVRGLRLSNLARNCRRFASEASVGEHGAASVLKWKRLSLFVALPSVILVSIHIFIEEMSHEHSRPEFIPYEHLRIRTKAFPWGDGKRTLLHNPHMNALQDGYEDEH